jgi:hypothetical protein
MFGMMQCSNSENIPWPIEKKPSLYSTEQVDLMLCVNCSDVSKSLDCNERIYLLMDFIFQTFYERRILKCKGHKYERDKPGICCTPLADVGWCFICDYIAASPSQFSQNFPDHMAIKSTPTLIALHPSHWFSPSVAARDADIAKRVAEMPKAIEKWREEQRKSRTKTELQKILNVPAKFVK